MHDPSEDDTGPDVRLVPLTRRDLDDAHRLFSLLTDAAQPRAGGTSEEPSHERLLERAREIFRHRRKRLEIFGRGMFGEPAFEMLLLLYIAQSGNRYTAGQLGQLSGASKSTASRWIDYLEREQWIQRRPHPTDLRLAFVTLTDKGIQRIELYLSETLARDA
jgi:DNA-binding MarR family transcriptional regulator